MKLSTRARYGVRALLDLAINGQSKPVSLKDIARRQEISMSYLEHLINPLVAGGILRTIRGSKGGIVLARPASQIKLIEIIELLEGSLSPVECVDCAENCRRSDDCVTRDIWVEVKEAIDGVLDSVSLQGLVDRQKARDNKGQMFYI
jgi:Rrf2 family transcriptional regulator, cysteine metabolism repressor